MCKMFLNKNKKEAKSNLETNFTLKLNLALTQLN